MADELQNHEAVATPEHQLLMDRFKSAFQGVLDYVKQHLPEHDLKSTVVDNLRAGWDNTAQIIKDDAAKAFESLKAQGEQAGQEALAAGEQIATDAAAGVEKAAGAVVESDAGTSNAGTSSTPSPAAGANSPATGSTESASAPSSVPSTDTPTAK